MKIKYKLKISLATCAVGLISLGSCDDKLNIEPTQSIDASGALINAQNVESAVIGLYANLGNPQLYGTNLLLLPDLQGGANYIRWDGTFVGYREVFRNAMTPINSEATRTWTEAYQTINLANNILEALPVIEDEDLQNQLKGEALFIRGILHFELVRLYALPWVAGAANTQLGVPLILTATKEEAQATMQYPRAIVAAVYNQVLADLTEAESLLPATNGVRANSFAATAFLSRVYLQQSDFARARDAANTVISSGNYTLNPIVELIYKNDNTAESIFEIQQNEQNNAGTSNDGLTTFYGSLPGIGRGDVRVETAFQNLYATTDTRRTNLLYIGTGTRAGRLRTGKYTEFSTNIPIIRLAEMYLIRAEANYRLGTTIGDTPLHDINLIRNRAKAPELTAITLEDILLERQLELAFEGQRIHDIKRTQSATGGYNFNDPELVFPIPQREIDANLALVQNPGY